MASHNLLLLSDVHLGSDLVHCVRPDAPARDAASDARDGQLARLFDWYREHRRKNRPWRLVIAGDLVDFVGMSVSPPQSVSVVHDLDEDDKALGLGAAEEHAVYKLRCVARRHPSVFESLARFVAAGNELVVVRGNHDVDFHWPSVQDEFVRQLALHAALGRGHIEFLPWFYYEEGRVYVEHGHQYDQYCSHEHLLNPVSPQNPRRSFRSLSDVLLRHVVRPTRGLGETGHERAGALDYLKFAFGLGIAGTVALAARFARAVLTLFSIWRAHMSEGAARIRQQHERRMADLAALMDLSLESLRALARLQRPPVTTSFFRLALTVMLDRLLLFALTAVSIALCLLLSSGFHPGLLGAASLGGVLLLTAGRLGRSRLDIEPSRELREGAARVVRLFPAAFVVMGHTHLPEVSPTQGSPATYVNLGAWSSAEGATTTEALPGAGTRTHLVVDEEDGRPLAELFVWDDATGPRRFSGNSRPPG